MDDEFHDLDDVPTHVLEDIMTRQNSDRTTFRPLPGRWGWYLEYPRGYSRRRYRIDRYDYTRAPPAWVTIAVATRETISKELLRRQMTEA